MSDALDISDCVLARYRVLAFELQRLEWSRWEILQGDVPMDADRLAAILQERGETRDKLYLFRGAALEQGVQLGTPSLEMARVLDGIIQRCIQGRNGFFRRLSQA